MFKQHAGYNNELVPVLSKIHTEVEMFQLMDAIDNIGLKAFWSQADFDSFKNLVDLPHEYRMPRDQVHYYLEWMGEVWSNNSYLDVGAIIFMIHSWCDKNKDRLRRATFAGVI